MDDVIRGQQDADLGAGRHDERLVDVQQVVVDGRRVDAGTLLARRVAVAREAAEERDARAEVLVVPLPLVARDLDRELRARGVLDLDQLFDRGDRHADQDQHRDDGPGRLEPGVVQHLVVGDRALRLPEAGHRIDHRAESEHRDDRADPQHDHVHAVDLAGQFADAHWHVQQVPVGPGGHGGDGRKDAGNGRSHQHPLRDGHRGSHWGWPAERGLTARAS